MTEQPQCKKVDSLQSPLKLISLLFLQTQISSEKKMLLNRVILFFFK